MSPIRVLLADDHVVVRQGLRALLEVEGDIQVVAEASTGWLAVRKAVQFSPDVILMDIAMQDSNGLEATQQIIRQNPSSKVLVLSSYDDEETIVKALAAGALGYLSKNLAPDALLEAVKQTHRGKKVLCTRTSIRPLPVEEDFSFLKADAKSTKLTSREQQTLQGIAEGKPNKVIASDLGISLKTVEKHRHTLMSKLNIHDIAGLTRYAARKNIINAE